MGFMWRYVVAGVRIEGELKPRYGSDTLVIQIDTKRQYKNMDQVGILEPTEQ